MCGSEIKAMAMPIEMKKEIECASLVRSSIIS